MGLADKVLAGDIQAAARLMRELEDEVPGALDELGVIYPHTGRAHVVGFTGAPGVGKSTLIGCLIDALRKRDITLGIVAVDPSSPFTGGAILADRIRMQPHNIDRGVFIRSAANRGWAGGLAKSTTNLIHVLDAMGKEIILVETVGSGQGEIDIKRVADTTVVMLSPISGDEMQMIKAGIMEIADIYVINKADRGGADNIAAAIDFMLGMKRYAPNEWKPSVVLTEAISGKGIDELVEQILKHREFLLSGGGLEKCRRERAHYELIETLESLVKHYVYEEAGRNGYLEELVGKLARKETNPASAAMELINRFTKQFKPTA